MTDGASADQQPMSAEPDAPRAQDKADVERWRRAARIVDDVMEMPTDACAAHIERECGDDATLREMVHRWLHAVASPTTLFEQPVWPADGIEAFADSVARRELPPGTRIGAWRIVRAIGSGGMGAVYEAARDDGAFTRRVALKVVHSASANAWFAKRLQQERQLLAGLDHPSIARLLDGGVLPDGTPFYAMELVDGSHIDEWCDAQRLDVHARIRLVRQVCAAVAYAHRQLVVHRDLKPSNILVSADGLVKIVDFGIAQSLLERPNEGDDGVETTDETIVRPADHSAERDRACTLAGLCVT